MKIILSLLALLFSLHLSAQEPDPQSQFWSHLEKHCGKAYEGKITAAPENNDFRNKKLVMHVRSCETDIMKIPFL